MTRIISPRNPRLRSVRRLQSREICVAPERRVASSFGLASNVSREDMPAPWSTGGAAGERPLPARC